MAISALCIPSLPRLGALLISGLAVLWMAGQVLLGVYTLGDLGMFYQTFSQGQSLLRTLLESAGEKAQTKRSHAYASSYYDLYHWNLKRPLHG